MYIYLSTNKYEHTTTRILRPNTFLNRMSALCGRMLFASTEVMHRPRFDFSLRIDIKNTYQLRMEK